MKRLFPLLVLGFLASCAPDRPKTKEENPEPNSEKTEELIKNPMKGIGAVKTVTLKTPLEEERVQRGLAIYEMKCSACHKLDEQRVVGPGWKNVTQRRAPEWIMNMVTNTDIMLDKDEEAQKLLELCLVRMPNQNISVGDARDILEYMRRNDGQK